MFTNALIETNRLYIRPYKIEDVEDLYRVVSEDNHYQYIPEDPPTKEDVRKIIEWSISCCKANTVEKIYKFNLGIIEKQTGTFIGYCGLGPNDLNAAEIEVYYAISHKFSGSGLAFEAASSIIDYGFNTIGLHKIVSIVSPHNLPSVRILQKLGFHFEYTVKNLTEEYKDFIGLDYYTLSKRDF